MKPKKLVKKSGKHVRTMDPWKSEVIHRSILVSCTFIVVFSHYFTKNKTITRPLDFIAFIGAIYAFIQLSRGKNFKHTVGVLALALIILFVAFLVVLFFMVFVI